MFKKYMCLVLSVLMVLCTISTTALAAQPSVDGLSASYISFTSGGAAFTEIPASAASVTANVNVSNASANASPVILWVGKYVDDVLTDVKYVRQTIAAGASNTPVSVTIDGVKKETETVTVNGTSTEREKSVILKAFVWTSFTGGKSLAPSASVPSDDSTFLFVTKNGQPWTEFNQNTYSYDIALDRATIEAVPTFSFAAKDNATKIEEPDAYAIGVNQVKVTTAKGTEKTYSIKIAYSRPNISVALTDDASKAGGVSQPKIIDGMFGTANDGLFTDRMNFKSVITGSNLVGGTLITFGTRNDVKPGNQEFHQTGKNLANFSASASGTMYVVMRARSTVYENAGWTAVANGTLPKNPDTGANYTTPEMTALYSGGELRIATDAPYAISWIQVQQNVPVNPANYTWCYTKTFAAGETLVIPTQGYDNDVIVPIVKFDDPKPIVQDDATLAALKYSVDSASHDISGFAPSSAGSVYNVTLPAGTASVGVSAIASQGAASTVAITADTSIDANNVVTLVDRKATVTVEVTAPDGVTKETYAVNFTAEKFIWEMQNKIYDVDVSNQTFYVPSKTTPETASVATMKLYGSPATDKFYITRGTGAGWAAVAVEDDLVRDVTLIAGDTGKLYTSSNTSAMFEGATSFKVSANAMRNKYNKFDESGNQIGAAAPTNGGSKFQPYFEGALSGTNGEPYWLSFKVTSPCTVYVSTVQGTSDWYNHPADWTKNTDSSLKLAGGNFYYKEYAAGETVNIPNYGTSDEIAGDRIFWEPNGVAIIWSTTPPSTNAALSGIKVNGVDVAGVSSSDASGKRYSATAAHDAVEAVVEATAADDGATITYSPADGKAASIPGTVEINVMAEDGETTATYYVDITRALPPSNTKLSKLTYNVGGGNADSIVDGFTADDFEGTYNVTLPAGVNEIDFAAEAADSAATVAFSANVVGGKVDVSSGSAVVTVEVTAENGDKKTFTVNFTKQTLIGEITTNGGLTVTKAATPLVFNSGLFVDRMNWVTPVIGEKLIGLDYFPIYSNKSAAAKALSETNGIYFSFVTEVPVTMYVASRDIMATTFETRGWKLIASTGLKNPATGNDYTVDELTALYDAGTGEISTASPYALVYGQRDEMTGSGTYGKLNWPGILSNTYAKTFAAGETVEIPTSGTTAAAPYVPVAKYHIPKVSTADDTALDIVLAGSTEMAFDGTDKYRITLSSDITSVKLSAVASAIGANVAISNENLTFGTGSRTANETITVTAPDGVTTKVYNVEIKVELPLSEQSDKVYDLRTATGQSIYPENNGYYDGDYVAGSSTGNRVAIVESITDDTRISANRSAKYSTLGTLVGATGILTFGSNALGGSYDDYTDGVKGIWYKDNGDGTYSRLGANSTAEGATKIDRTSYFRPFYNESVYNTSSFKLDDEYTWYEFKISSPATVYVGQDFEGAWALGESNGWSNVTGGKVKMWGNTLYSKHYNAGETVKIPIRGGFTDVTRTMWETFAVAVMWDDKVVKSSDAKLSSLTYQIGSEAAVAVNGFNAADEGGTYSVDLPAGTTSVTVAATAADAGASAPVYSSEGGVVDVTSGSGTITVTTLAEDGTTTHTYTINFTVAVESNYNLKSLTYNGISIPKFTQDYYTYVIYMPTAAPVAIVGTPVDSSKAVVVSDDTVPTTAGKEVTVTVGEGADSKTYTLTIYLDERADRVLNVSGPFADDSTVAVVADGESSADFKGATKVFAYTTDASKAAFFSDKYDGSDVNSYWTEFIVSSGATVYYVDTIGAFDPTTSWIINPNGFVKVGTANAYTIKLNESVTASAANGNFYMKKVEAGGVIQLPAYGSTGAPSDTASIETLPFCIVVWDSSIVTPPVEEGGIEDGGE